MSEFNWIPEVIGMIGGESTNAANAKQASNQMDFQRLMSNSAHQREMTDLSLAGLNPILASKYGGASTPSGAMATMQNSAASAMSLGMEYRRNRQEVKNMEATNSQIEAGTAKILADTNVSNATAKSIQADLPQKETAAEFWISALSAAKGLNQEIVQPLIQRLRGMSSGKGIAFVDDAIETAKSILKVPQRIYHSPAQKRPPNPTKFKETFIHN